MKPSPKNGHRQIGREAEGVEKKGERMVVSIEGNLAQKTIAKKMDSKRQVSNVKINGMS